MLLGHFVLSTDVSLRANMTVEAEINAFDDEYDDQNIFESICLKDERSAIIHCSRNFARRS